MVEQSGSGTFQRNLLVSTGHRWTIVQTVTFHRDIDVRNIGNLRQCVLKSGLKCLIRSIPSDIEGGNERKRLSITVGELNRR